MTVIKSLQFQSDYEFYSHSLRFHFSLCLWRVIVRLDNQEVCWSDWDGEEMVGLETVYNRLWK